MTQQAQDNQGFTLPPPVEGEQSQTPPAESAGATGASPGTASDAPGSLTGMPADDVDTSSRDTLIGGGVLLVLFIAFFFAKNAYANMLVAKRVPPGKANAAGWWLFVFLAGLSSAVVLAAVNPAKFMAPLIVGPLALVSLVALVLMFVSGRK